MYLVEVLVAVAHAPDVDRDAQFELGERDVKRRISSGD